MCGSPSPFCSPRMSADVLLLGRADRVAAGPVVDLRGHQTPPLRSIDLRDSVRHPPSSHRFPLTSIDLREFL